MGDRAGRGWSPFNNRLLTRAARKQPLAYARGSVTSVRLGLVFYAGGNFFGNGSFTRGSLAGRRFGIDAAGGQAFRH